MKTMSEMRHWISVLEQHLAYQTQAAQTDRLTRLDNRIGLERRTTARGGWFVALDLDGFKKAQDRSPDGHAYGDRVLVEFAEFLRGNTRNSPDRDADRVAARTGGDEFVVWVPIREAADRIVAESRMWRSSDGRVLVSAGAGHTLREADAAMYQDKRSKRSWFRKLVAS